MTNLFVERLLGPKSKSLKSSKASPEPEPANASAPDNFGASAESGKSVSEPSSSSVAAVQAKLAQANSKDTDGSATSESAGSHTELEASAAEAAQSVPHEPMDFSAASRRFEGFDSKDEDTEVGLSDQSDSLDKQKDQQAADAELESPKEAAKLEEDVAKESGSHSEVASAKEEPKPVASKPARVPPKPTIAEKRREKGAEENDAVGDGAKVELSDPTEELEAADKAAKDKPDVSEAKPEKAVEEPKVKMPSKPVAAKEAKVVAPVIDDQPKQEASKEAKASKPATPASKPESKKAAAAKVAEQKVEEPTVSSKKPEKKAEKAAKTQAAKPASSGADSSNVTQLKPTQAKSAQATAGPTGKGKADTWAAAASAATGAKPARRPSKAAALIAAKKAEMAKTDDAGSGAVRRPDAAMAAPKPDKAKKNPEDLTSEDITMMIEEAGALLTGPGGAYERRPEQRELMALFENGLFLVSRSHIDDPHVLSFAGLLRRKGMTIDMIPVEIAILAKCYESGVGGDDQVVKADDEATSMQREIVRFIAECARLKASDAHVVVSHGSAIVRLRIDGVLKDFMEWRSAYGADFCAAAFAMADASDASYQPYEYQAARISDTSVRLPGGVQALRLQFNPLSYGGRHMVARFLYRTQGVVGDVDTLGYAEKQITQIKRMRAVPMGINIVAGPTGSGKSTTLQRILSTLMQERRNEIATFTVEDPPEYVIEGAQQMPVTNASTAEERKEKFNAAIRAALRSDPDVIMIGEIRDSESAKLAFEAAMTGHQVWATLHAVDALTIVSRLKDIGVDEFKLYDPAVFTGLVGQRLTRALCDGCKIPIMQARDEGMVDDELWERTLSVYSRDIEGIYVEGKGCPKCNGTGVVGRSVVAEVLLPDDAFMEYMKNDDKLSARRHWVENLNGITMMGHGILKAKTGVCSTYEIERMLGPLELDRDRVRKVAAE